MLWYLLPLSPNLPGQRNKQNTQLVSITNCLFHESLQNLSGPTARQKPVTASASWSLFSPLRLCQSHPVMTSLLRAIGAFTSAERPRVSLSSLPRSSEQAVTPHLAEETEGLGGEVQRQRKRVADIS